MLKLSGRQWSGWDVWICCLAAILLMDPVAILSQSLWLSAAAVAALIFWYQWFPCPEWQLPPVLRAVVSLIHLQRSEEHTSELQSRFDLVCRLLLEKKKNQKYKMAAVGTAN